MKSGERPLLVFDSKSLVFFWILEVTLDFEVVFYKMLDFAHGMNSWLKLQMMSFSRWSSKSMALTITPTGITDAVGQNLSFKLTSNLTLNVLPSLTSVHSSNINMCFFFRTRGLIRSSPPSSRTRSVFWFQMAKTWPRRNSSAITEM